MDKAAVVQRSTELGRVRNLEAIRARCWHYLTPEVAARCEMSLFDLQQFLAKSFTPSRRQLEQLALRLHMRLEVEP